jgi:hypothetical protein
MPAAATSVEQRTLGAARATFAGSNGFQYAKYQMSALRRRIRAVAIAWLLCQVASLAAFVPEQCCVSHAAEAAAKAQNPPCHETAPAAPRDGDACPMHHGKSRSHDCCTIKNSCNGPGTSLTTLFAFIGFVEKPVQSSIALEASAAFVPASPALLQRLALPDAPPPKA